MAAKIELNAIANFDIHGDKLSQSWERWHRSFELYSTGKGITDAKQNRALLLHSAGLDVQDIFFTLEEEDGDDDYLKCVNTLKKYFTSKVNFSVERYNFRSIRQLETETIDQYITKLKQQVVLCDFNDPDSQIRDQVIEKCRSHKLRTRLLEQGPGLTLDNVRTIARTLESAEKHAKDLENNNNSVTVNKIHHKAQAQGGSTQKYRQGKQNSACYRCGKTGHFGKDANCPAKGKKCHNCGKMDHFAKVCKTKNAKSYKRENRRVRYVEQDLDSDNEYAFIVSGENVNENIQIQVGGVNLIFIIDSGASVNVISSSTWQNLKQNKIKCDSQKSDKKLYAYGSDKPLNVIGKFSCNVKVKSQNVEAEFYVVEGNSPSLLGKHTAVGLGVFKLGVNFVSGNIHEEYKDLFSGVGKLKNYKLKLHINEDVEPVAQPMYRIPFTLRDKVSRKLQELESHDIIEKVNAPTPWVSPVIVVPKPNGDIRLCVDMRKANTAIVRERHPIPTVDEILYKMNGGEVFSKLDLNQGFHQLELDESSREITTFVTHNGLYRYRRLMFGINAAPEKYQQVISQVFNDIEGVQNISDDIVIFGSTREEHDIRLKQVLERMRDKNLTLNRDKCEFTMNKITFMGHVLSKKGIGPTSDRIKDILNATEPKNASEVKSFLGLVNFSARYIPNLATLSEPLRKLTKKNEQFRWEKEQQDSFRKLKNSLSENDTLGYFKLNAEKTQLITDASNVGLGAVLIQKDKGESKVICYASRSLTDIEKKYSTTEKEALAVVWACEKFHLYLYGIQFELLTDHKPLEGLYNSKSKPNARIQRWILRLMPYSYTIKYLPGKQNIADALSRLINTNTSQNDKYARNRGEEYIRFVAKQATPRTLTITEIEKESKHDEEITEVRNSLSKEKWDKSLSNYYPMRTEISQLGFILLRGTRIIIPKTLRLKCIQLAHEGHLGIVGTKQMLRSKVWWPNIDKEVEHYVKSCHGCQLTSTMPHPEPLEQTKLPEGPWEYLAIDLLGPLPSGHYVFVVIDYYSRYYEIDITKDTSSEKMIDSLDSMFSRHGLPYTIRSDNGPQFTSKEFQQYLSAHTLFNHYFL